MAQNKLLSILVLLLLVFFQEMQCIAGRPLILDQKPKFQKVQTHGRVLAKETEAILDGKVNLHGVNINAADASTQSPPSPPNVVVGASQAPPPKPVDDFRPTAPGHSPGVGHSIQN
ncbi:precursor of CEP5 [Herrania umbratica]|uniref:Precursor of CEP5 n=1 Tax=Herrania umbratica TaxID=108875 RepID=A0A6J0ZM56_9ROSI|nr:precursor of CEP5 [Herrania umbratica]